MTFRKDNFLFLLLTLWSFTGFAQTSKDSLLSIVASSDASAIKIKALIDIAVIHSDKYELDSAIVYGNNALRLSNTTLDTLMKGESYYAIAYAYDIAGKLESAFDNYESARQQFVLLDNDVNVIKAMNGKGIAAFFAGDFGQALKYYLETLRYAEDKNMLKQQADLKQNIANIYRKDSTKYQHALDMYFDSYEIRKVIKDTIGVEHSYYAIGITYLDMENFDQAKIYFDSSIYLNQYINDPLILGRTYNELGHAYYELKQDYLNAKKYLTLAKTNLKNSPIQGFKFRNLLTIGKVDTSMGDYLSAEKNFQLAYELVKDTERDELILSAYELLRDAQSKSGNYKNAFENSIKYQSLYQTIKSTEREKYIEELQTEYGLEQKEKQIVIQELQLSQAANEKRIFTLFMILLAISLISAIAFLYTKSKTNKILTAQKSQIQKSLEEKEVLLREIHHRVKNNLQVISSLLSLQGRYTDDPNIESAIREGKDRVKSMSLIHQNLYQKDNLTGVEVKDYFLKLFTSLFSSYNIHPERIKLELNIPDLNLDIDTIVPIGLMVNEMVSNSLKHAFPNERSGLVSITLKETENGLQLIVKDNGIGLDHIDLLSQEESFGFTLIDTFKEKLNAELDIKSDQGTMVELLIKNYKIVA